MKVLVAEDDRTTSAQLDSVLVGWGYDVAVASDGAEAWTVLPIPRRPAAGDT